MSANVAVEPATTVRPADRFLNPAALGAIAIWSATAPIGKYALDEFPALAYSALRPVIGAILLFGYLLVTRQRLWLPAADLRRIALVGVFGLGLSQLCYIGALSRTSVAHTVILASISPLVVAVYRLTVKRAPLPPSAMFGILGGFLGVVLLVGGSEGGGGTSLLGDSLAFVSALTWMIVTMAPTAVFARQGTVRPMAWMVLSSLMIQIPAGAAAIVDTTHEFPHFLSWASLAYSAVFGALIGNALWQRAVQQVGATRTLIYLYLQPLGAMVLAALMLGERLSPVQAVGGALALVGVGLVRRG
jgi:drug/metabolite transporter (DMT)-like permease